VISLIKVNEKTTRYVIAITLAYTVLVAFTGFSKIAPIPLNTVTRYILNFSIEGAYLIMLLFLASVLRFIREKKSLIDAFLIYLLLDTIIFLLRIFIFGTAIINGNLPLNLFAFFVTIYFIVYTMKVKHKSFSTPFKLFGQVMLCSIIFRIVGAVMYIQHYTGRNVLSYMVMSELFGPIAVLYILYKNLIHLRKNPMPNIPLIEAI
jgi:hypothetical protein